MHVDLSSNIRVVFLIFLAVCAGFIGNTLNCSIQKIMTNNAAVRHLFVVLIIYFTIDFTSKNNMNPTQIFQNTLLIYLLFILLTKQTYEMFIFNILLIFVIYNCYIINQYVRENKERKYLGLDKESVEMIDKYLQHILIVTLIIGFVLYFNKQYNDHKKDFSFITFLVGLNRCSSL